MGRSKLDMSNLILNVHLFMYSIERIRFGTWKVRRLNWVLSFHIHLRISNTCVIVSYTVLHCLSIQHISNPAIWKASDFTILKQVVHVKCFVQFAKIVRLCWSTGHGYKWRARVYIHYTFLGNCPPTPPLS